MLNNTAKVQFDNIDIVSLMFVELILKNKFIQLKEYNEKTKIAKFNVLNLVNLEDYNLHTSCLLYFCQILFHSSNIHNIWYCLLNIQNTTYILQLVQKYL